MKSNHQKIQAMYLLLSFGFLLLSLVAFYFLYFDMNKKIVKAEKEEFAWRTEAERRSKLQLVNRSLKALEAERVVFDSHFVKSSDIVPFLNMVETLAPKAGAKVEVSLVDIPKDNSGLIVEMRTRGRFEAVYEFLRLLENSPYELDFLTIDVQYSEVSDEGKISSTWLGVFRVKVLSFVP